MFFSAFADSFRTFDSNEPVVPVDLVIERTLVCERYLIDLPVGNLIEVINSDHNNLPMFFCKGNKNP